MKKLTFKTGRKYDTEQVIKAFSEDGCVITFEDDSRDLSYSFENSKVPTDWDKNTVMDWYDGNRKGKPEVYWSINKFF